MSAEISQMIQSTKDKLVHEKAILNSLTNPADPSFINLNISLDNVSSRLKDLGMSLEDLESISERINGLSRLHDLCQQLSRIHKDLTNESEDSAEVLLRHRDVLESLEDTEVVSHLKFMYEEIEMKTIIKHDEVEELVEESNKETNTEREIIYMITKERLFHTDLTEYIDRLIEESKSLPAYLEYEKLSQIRQIGFLYISLRKVSLKDKILSPFGGSSFYATNMHLARYLEDLPVNVEVADIVNFLKTEGEEVLSNMLKFQQKEVVSFVNAVNLEDIDTKFLFYKTKYEKAMEKIYEIANVWEDQLTREEHLKLVGKLSDSLISEVIAKVFNMQDICSQDCEAIASLFANVSGLIELFEEAHFCRSWSKLDMMRTILESDISRILEMNNSGVFKDKVSYYELRHLINAMYEDSEARRSVIKTLENS